MEEVTDVAFREMFAKYSSQSPTLSAIDDSSPNRQIHSDDEDTLERGGRSTATLEGKTLRNGVSGFSPLKNNFVMYTEFVNVDGLTHPEGFKRLSIDLKFTEAQRPMVAQIWGRDPEKFYQAAQIVSKMGFDGIDINMGCPQDKEIGQGTCAALILEPKLAQEIIFAVQRGSNGLPVSVKTRIGYNQNTISEWLKYLLDTNVLSAIAVHGRTKKEKSKVPASWQAIAQAVQTRNAEKSSTLIIGNGDVKSREEGLERAAQTGVDGVMIGRGAFGNPWIFRNGYMPSTAEKLNVMLEHSELFQKEFFGIKHFAVMRKHFKAYCSGFEGSAELRAKLMEAVDLEETKKIVGEYIESTNGTNLRRTTNESFLKPGEGVPIWPKN